MTEMDVNRIKAGNFARNNGQVLQAVNILRIKFNKLSGIERVVKSSGMAPDEFLESVNFLAEEGYIHLRYISTKETATLADAEYTALEAKLTGKGIRLRAGGIDDDMVEVSSSDKSLLRAGNFVQNNGGVLRPLNILSHKYNRLGNLQSLLAGEGVAEDEFLDSVNFLASEGYIHLRLISTREPALLADHEYTELEGKLTSRGKRLLKGGIEDNMIEV